MASEETTFREFGESLKRARIDQSRSLDEIASYTKIHRRHLEAIEQGDISLLPQGPYVKAFLREYARAVGLKVPEVFAMPSAPPPASPKDPRVVSRPVSAIEEVLPISAVAKETARFANTAVETTVKTVTKTAESVVKFIESGSKEALEVVTSKSLWDEADQVRRERLGLPMEPPKEQRLAVRPVEKPAANIESGVASIATSASTTLAEQDAAEPADSAREADDRARAASEKSRVSSRGATNVIIALLALLFGGAAFFAIKTYRQDASNGTALNKDYIPAPLDKPQGMTPPKPTATTAPAPVETVAAPVGPKDSLKFILKATEPVWVSIAPDGLPAYKGELKAGESRAFRAGDRFIINIGNQKSVQMSFNGQSLSNLPTIANSGVVVRNLVLTRDKVSLGGQEVPVSSTIAQPVSTPTPVVQQPTPQTTPQTVQPFQHTTPPSSHAQPTKNSQGLNSAGSTHIPAVGHSPTTLKPASNLKSSTTSSGTKSPVKKPSGTTANKQAPKKSKNSPFEIHPLEPRPARP